MTDTIEELNLVPTSLDKIIRLYALSDLHKHTSYQAKEMIVPIENDYIRKSFQLIDVDFLRKEKSIIEVLINQIAVGFFSLREKLLYLHVVCTDKEIFEKNLDLRIKEINNGICICNNIFKRCEDDLIGNKWNDFSNDFLETLGLSKQSSKNMKEYNVNLLNTEKDRIIEFSIEKELLLACSHRCFNDLYKRSIELINHCENLGIKPIIATSTDFARVNLLPPQVSEIIKNFIKPKTSVKFDLYE